ncbi:MAG: UPF0755 protein [Gammaproteobacteria bacterium]|jgi:UPF0755 protein
MLLKFIKKIILYGVILVFLAVSVLTIQLFRFQYKDIQLPGDVYVFLIEPGASIKSISVKLSLEKIIEDPWLFILLAKLKGVETKVRAGEYQLRQGQSTSGLLELFTTGNSIQYSFTVIEGWSFRQMMAQLENNRVIKNTLKNFSDEEIMIALGLDGQHPEGLFYPDTYLFPKGTSDLQFLKRSYQLMQKHLQKAWENRAKNLPLNSAYEALILASIIEKETGAGHERSLISAVFIQRLNLNMRLQTDPTVIYGMGESFDGNIRRKDLRTDTPYNTYLRKGLPPTPIALPGLDSIEAALNPADTKALYFVSKGDGTHYFSKTLKEHNNAVIKYQLKGRQPKKKMSSQVE